MGVTTETIYVCDGCGTTQAAAQGPGPGPAMGGGPMGWISLQNGALWFHSWGCVADYATAQASPAPVTP